MEGLAAVGAASSIIQLVDFSLKLIATGKEIRDSLTGSSLQNEALEDVYRQMKTVLEPVEGLAAVNVTRPVGPGHGSIRAAARTALKDCSEILNLLEQLKLKSGGHKRWSSTIMAFRSMMGQKKVIDIETRLRTGLASVSIELTKLTWGEVRRLNDNVTELIRRASYSGIQNDSHLEQLAKSFASLSTNSGSANASPAHSTTTLMKDVGTLFERAKEYDSVRNITNAKQAVINSLHFPSRMRRHEAIPNNHKETFGWIYSTPSFRQWIEEEGGIFWIYGKPGSGKSTLMKLLAHDPRTHASLHKWAHPHKATIAAHYFWNLGTDMQKSLLGLLQTLVHEIFRKSPDSIQSACPTRWKMALEDHYVFSNQKKYDLEGQWTMDELSETIQRLGQSEDSNVHSRLCLFVDGLDEFEGDHRQVCKLLALLTGLPHVKVCLSSRPLNVFRDEFDGDETRKLAIDCLTNRDMELFVNDHLVSHRNWGGGAGNCTIDAEDKTSLVNEIRERANGVFLWVALVTKSICDGLTNQDSLHDLRERLHLLPTDLGDLFKHILNRVDPAYSKKSAEYLWIALHEKNGGLPLDAYYYHERDHEDENYAVEWPVGPREVDAQVASRRITALTGGLLETTPGSDKVTFLHRTVAEFLVSRDIVGEIMTRMRPNFDVYVALAKISTVLLKCSRQIWQDCIQILVKSYLHYAGRRNFESTVDLLDALEQTALQMGFVDLFKTAVVLSPLSKQVSRKLSMDKSYFSSCSSPAATLLLTTHNISNTSVDMLRVLGEHGQGLNHSPQMSRNTSPWAMFFQSLKMTYLNDYILSFQKLLDIGADSNAQVSYSRCSQSVFSVYLVLSFSYHARDVNPEPYLTTLDVFLDRAADFWQPITFHPGAGPIDERYWWPTKIDSRYNTAEKVLSKGLRLLGSDTQMVPNRNLVFHTVKRILAKRSDDAALMSRLRIAIPQASFPENMSSALLNMIPRTKPRRRAQKRKVVDDEVSDVERPARRGRKSTQDATRV